MSERTWTIVILVLSITASMLLGWAYGRAIGRAEQKKLDEAECAAHPVVKEVPAPTPSVLSDIRFHICERAVDFRGREYGPEYCKDETFPWDPPTKPAKAKRQPNLIMQGGYACYEGAGDFVLTRPCTDAEQKELLRQIKPAAPKQEPALVVPIVLGEECVWDKDWVGRCKPWAEAPKPQPAPKPAHDALKSLFKTLDTHSGGVDLMKFYITIPPTEGHWEVYGTDRVNAFLRLGSTVWTESEWKECKSCAEDRNVEAIAEERWKRQMSAKPQPAGLEFPAREGRCSVDGVHWFAPRSDGICYAADSPNKPTVYLSQPQPEVRPAP